MGARDEYFELIKKFEGYKETPYFDEKAVDNVVSVFEHFVNHIGNDQEVVAAGAKFANDELVQEMLAEHGITVPKDEHEAQDRRIDAVGAELTHMHRTLNQTFGRLVRTYVKVNAAAYRAGLYDARNEGICRLCYEWDEATKGSEISLPFV